MADRRWVSASQAITSPPSHAASTRPGPSARAKARIDSGACSGSPIGCPVAGSHSRTDHSSPVTRMGAPCTAPMASRSPPRWSLCDDRSARLPFDEPGFPGQPGRRPAVRKRCRPVHRQLGDVEGRRVRIRVVPRPAVPDGSPGAEEQPLPRQRCGLASQLCQPQEGGETRLVKVGQRLEVEDAVELAARRGVCGEVPAGVRDGAAGEWRATSCRPPGGEGKQAPRDSPLGLCLADHAGPGTWASRAVPARKTWRSSSWKGR